MAALSKAGYRVIAFDRRGWDEAGHSGDGSQPRHASEEPACPR